MSELVLDAPIAAVAVYPDRARVTRRARIQVSAGDQEVTVEPLPLALQEDSVRVAGHGPATVLGVDVSLRHHPSTPDEAVAGLEQQRRTIEAEVGELADADEIQAELDAFLRQLSRRAGGSYARSLAAGSTEPDTVTAFTDSLAGRLATVRTRRRELAVQRRDAEDRLSAVERRLAAVSMQREPDRKAATVALAAESPGEVELELSYLVAGAGWMSSYDARLTGDRLTLNWYGMVMQRTGEDWPECELTLSTARPSAAATVPELDPWYLDRYRPPVPLPGESGAHGRQAMAYTAPMALTAADTSEEYAADVPFAEAAATVEQGVTAASYTPARPVAVPADGAAHRTTIAAVDLGVELDHVTAPVRSTEVHLRATVVNSSNHTMPAGQAAVFHEADFVGSAALPVWAPGEQVELALGLDDRVRVERELVRRGATKATLGSARRRELEYQTTVTNHTTRPAKVTVLDQLPVSRDHEITVKPLLTDPQPDESTDLGVLTWRLDLEPGAESTIRLGLRVDVGRNVEVAGWRE